MVSRIRPKRGAGGPVTVGCSVVSSHLRHGQVLVLLDRLDLLGDLVVAHGLLVVDAGAAHNRLGVALLVVVLLPQEHLRLLLLLLRLLLLLLHVIRRGLRRRVVRGRLLRRGIALGLRREERGVALRVLGRGLGRGLLAL